MRVMVGPDDEASRLDTFSSSAGFARVGWLVI